MGSSSDLSALRQKVQTPVLSDPKTPLRITFSASSCIIKMNWMLFLGESGACHLTAQPRNLANMQMSYNTHGAGRLQHIVRTTVVNIASGLFFLHSHSSQRNLLILERTLPLCYLQSYSFLCVSGYVNRLGNLLISLF